MSDTPWKDDPRYGGMSEEAARKSWENRRSADVIPAPEVAGAEIVEGNALGMGRSKDDAAARVYVQDALHPQVRVRRNRRPWWGQVIEAHG